MKKLAWVSLALLSVGVQAATLSTSRNINLLVVDGKKVESSFWSPIEKVELSEGKHQIVVRFDGEVKNGSKDTILTTRPYLFDIDITDQDATIVLPRLTTLSQAKAHFDRGADWSLKYADGMTETIKYTELQGSGFAAYSDMEALVAEYNRNNGIVFEQGYAVDLEDVAVQVTEQGELKITGDSLTQLKMWYAKASDQEKKSFKIWMAEHDFN